MKASNMKLEGTLYSCAAQRPSARCSRIRMKRIRAIMVLLISTAGFAQTGPMEDPDLIAKQIIQSRLATTPIVGASTNAVLLRELDSHLYRAVLDSKDKKLKVLITIKILKDMPYIHRPGYPTPSDEERLTTLAKNPQYQILKDRYFQLVKDDRIEK